MINRNIAPRTQKIDSLQFQSPIVGILDNNIIYHGLYSGNSPIIKLDLIFSAGVEYQSFPLQSVYANSLIKEAPKGMLPNEAAEFFDFYGSYVETFTGPETSGLRLFVPTKSFEVVLPIFANLVKTPLLPKDEFEILTKKYEQSILNNLKKTKYVAMRGLNNQIFGNSHPLGYFVEPEDALKVSHTDVVGFVSKNYCASNCKIIISGDYNDKAVQLLNDNFGEIDSKGNWANEFQKNKLSEPAGAMEKLKLYEFPEAVQSSIYGGLLLDVKTDEDIIVLGILITVFGGYFGSRLMKNIREDKGYTYGIGSFIVEYSNTMALKIVSDVGVDVTGKAIDEVYKEIELLRKVEISKEELDLVRNYMMGELISSLDGVIPTSMILEKLISRNRTGDFIHKNIEIINSVTTDDLIRFANIYFDPDRLSFTVAGKC